jgi:hypothetical protein
VSVLRILFLGAKRETPGEKRSEIKRKAEEFVLWSTFRLDRILETAELRTTRLVRLRAYSTLPGLPLIQTLLIAEICQRLVANSIVDA